MVNQSKTHATHVKVIHLDDPESAYLLQRAIRIVVTLKGNVELNLEGERVRVDGEHLVIRLSQGESAALGAGSIKCEVTMALPYGTVMKTQTITFPLTEAVRKKTT